MASCKKSHCWPLIQYLVVCVDLPPPWVSSTQTAPNELPASALHTASRRHCPWPCRQGHPPGRTRCWGQCWCSYIWPPLTHLAPPRLPAGQYRIGWVLNTSVARSAVACCGGGRCSHNCQVVRGPCNIMEHVTQTSTCPWLLTFAFGLDKYWLGLVNI